MKPQKRIKVVFFGRKGIRLVCFLNQTIGSELVMGTENHFCFKVKGGFGQVGLHLIWHKINASNRNIMAK